MVESMLVRWVVCWFEWYLYVVIFRSERFIFVDVGFVLIKFICLCFGI